MAEELKIAAGGSFHFNHEDEEPGHFGIGAQDKYFLCAGCSVTPAEARALAALLLKHADRAEGKTS